MQGAGCRWETWEHRKDRGSKLAEKIHNIEMNLVVVNEER